MIQFHCEGGNEFGDSEVLRHLETSIPSTSTSIIMSSILSGLSRRLVETIPLLTLRKVIPAKD